MGVPQWYLVTHLTEITWLPIDGNQLDWQKVPWHSSLGFPKKNVFDLHIYIYHVLEIYTYASYVYMI